MFIVVDICFNFVLSAWRAAVFRNEQDWRGNSHFFSSASSGWICILGVWRCSRILKDNELPLFQARALRNNFRTCNSFLYRLLSQLLTFQFFNLKFSSGTNLQSVRSANGALLAFDLSLRAYSAGGCNRADCPITSMKKFANRKAEVARSRYWTELRKQPKF